MGIFNRNDRKRGFMEEIRCDKPSYLIWKWRPVGSSPNINNRENAIRWGSSLRVKDGEVAVFVYKQKDGTMQDFIEGPFDKTIKTANLPCLASLLGLAYEGGTPFQAEVYFINLAKIVQVKFGVPFFDVYDPRFIDFGVPVAVRGTISFRIVDYREFIKLHRLVSFSLDDFQKQIRDAVCRYVKDCVASAPEAHNLSVLQLESKIAQINDIIEYDLGERLKENFGILVSAIDIAAIDIDKGSSGYYQLMEITKNATTARIQAETTDYVERLRIQREENQYAAHKATQTANLGAFQIEKQAEVGVASAAALGQMGADRAKNANQSGGNSGGFNIPAIMAEMAIGGVIGKNIADTMNNMTNNTSQQKEYADVPPIVAIPVYYVAANGNATGPYDISVLKQMAITGQLSLDSLVWKKGMAQWVKAETVDELKDVFVDAMPSIPNTED